MKVSMKKNPVTMPVTPVPSSKDHCHLLRRLLPEPIITDATTGEGALALLTEGAFDIAFLDEFYGGEGTLKGTDVSRSVRALEALRSSRPLLIFGCTGNAGSAEHSAFAQAAGQDACYGKPFPKDFARELAERIHARRQGRG